ncbi:MAG: hypothetical protein QOD99_3154 [Chthoniobacter sp.]|jgi:hypothetical protein|nr:hypothetical protein [Chthoniobacter sp.]
MPDAAKNALSLRWAGGLGAALIGGFAIVAAFTCYDHLHRPELETVTEPTAVGDSDFIQPPAGRDAVLGRFQGKKLVASQRIKARDTRMRKAGMDDGGKFYVYRSSEPNDRDALFLKVAPEDYLRIDLR